MREERKLRLFERRVLGRIFGPKRDEVNYIRMSLVICTAHPVLFG